MRGVVGWRCLIHGVKEREAGGGNNLIWGTTGGREEETG